MGCYCPPRLISATAVEQEVGEPAAEQPVVDRLAVDRCQCGIGDLIATCSSRQSRNNTVGLELGRGRDIEEILGEMKMVAEGVKSSPSVVALAELHGIEMPICQQVVAVCHQGARASEALLSLMGRENKSELAGYAE